MIGLLAVTPPVFYGGQQVQFTDTGVVLTGTVMEDLYGNTVWHDANHVPHVTVRTLSDLFYYVPVRGLR